MPSPNESSAAAEEFEPGSETKVVCAIPARWKSERLPGKPLLELGGKPIIQHVWERACQARDLTRVVVLTDHEPIQELIQGLGGECEMTPEDCASGTDRVAWAARHWIEDALINVQGDEPFLDPHALTAVARFLRDNASEPMVTLASLAEPGELEDPNCVKVVCGRFGHALYFSRSPIPFCQDGSVKPLRHLGLYGYRRQTLLDLAGLEPTPLERAERLEQLRALENGISIRVLEVQDRAFGIDTPEDLARAEAMLASQTNGDDSPNEEE